MRTVLEKLNLPRTSPSSPSSGRSCCARASAVRARSSPSPSCAWRCRWARRLRGASAVRLVQRAHGGGVQGADHHRRACCSAISCRAFWCRTPIAKRQQEIQKKFPDALDLMVICIETGHLAGSGVRARHRRDGRRRAGPVGGNRHHHGRARLPRATGARRSTISPSAPASPPIKSLVTSLIQSEKYGTPLGVALARRVAGKPRDAHGARPRKRPRRCRRSSPCRW